MRDEEADLVARAIMLVSTTGLLDERIRQWCASQEPGIQVPGDIANADANQILALVGTRQDIDIRGTSSAGLSQETAVDGGKEWKEMEEQCTDGIPDTSKEREGLSCVQEREIHGQLVEDHWQVCSLRLRRVSRVRRGPDRLCRPSWACSSIVLATTPTQSALVFRSRMPSSAPSSVVSAGSGSGRHAPTSPRSSVSHRTLDNIRDEVAHSIAVRAIMKATTIEDARISVYFTFSKKDDDVFLRRVAEIIRAQIPSRHLFAIGTTGAPSPSSPTNTNTLVITGAEDDDVQRAVLLFSSKFLGRVASVTNHGHFIVAAVHEVGGSSYDSAALWDVLSKSVRAPLDPLSPPLGSRSIDQLVIAARARLQRVTPRQAWEILHDPTYPIPAFLVDIRPASQRARSGGIHGSLIIERNDLEWRFDPRSEARLAIADRYDLRIIVYCEDGHASSLAASSLHDVGLLNATDMIGGFEAWKAEGLSGQIKPPSTLSESGTWEALSQPSPVSD